MCVCDDQDGQETQLMNGRGKQPGPLRMGLHMEALEALDGQVNTWSTLWLFNIAMENGTFIDGLPIKNGDFPWLCKITRGYYGQLS